MKYIVTGGNGFIGSNLVDELIDNGHEVIVIDNHSAESNEEFFFNDKAENYDYDICDYEKILPLFKGVDVIFHLAAESRIQPTLKDPILAAKSNTVGTCTILQCAREQGVKRIVYSSTSSSYGLKNEPPLREDMHNDCLNPYSVTKAAGEDLCKMYTNLFGLETVVFRYFNVYGERHPVKGQYAPVIGIFIRQKNDNESMTIVGDGEQRRDFTNVKDVVKANILAADLNNKDVVGETINVGNGDNHSINEIADMVGGNRIHLPERKGEARTTLADVSKIKKLLNFVPSLKVNEWIERNKVLYLSK